MSKIVSRYWSSIPLFSDRTSRKLPTYHDWVAPEGYFTERGREVPPGCEEIDEQERLRRERESMQLMQEAFDEHHPDEPTMHPSVAETPEDE